MANKLSNMQLEALKMGGADGPKRQNGAAAFTGGEIHRIRILTDATVFSVLAAVDKDGSAVNMLTANNLTSKEFNIGDEVYPPFGGYFTAFTSAAEVEYFTMPKAARDQKTA